MPSDEFNSGSPRAHTHGFRLKTVVRTRMRPRRYECPGPGCSRRFKSTTNVLQHLNNPLSSCVAWYRRAEEAIITGGPHAKVYQARFDKLYGKSEIPQQNIRGNPDEDDPAGYLESEPMSIDSEDRSPLHQNQPGANQMHDFASGNWKEAFQSAAQTLPDRGQNFLEWIDEDRFNEWRAENLYYPFACELEWEFASFLMRSSLRMREINDFLQLGLVHDHTFCNLTVLILLRFVAISRST